MIFTLIYNEFTKLIDININKKLGLIQEDLLNKCMLMIYNIEYTEIIIKNKIDTSIDTSIDTFKDTFKDTSKIYIIGNTDVNFNLTLKEFLDSIEKKYEDIDKIIIYDRKRDFNGNVIKDNIIIETYIKWIQTYENNNFNNNFFDESNEILSNISGQNRHIIRFPMESLLTNILNSYPNTTPNTTPNIELDIDPNIEINIDPNTDPNRELDIDPNIEINIGPIETINDTLNDALNDALNDESANIELTIDTDYVNITNQYFNNFHNFELRLNEMIHNYQNSNPNSRFNFNEESKESTEFDESDESNESDTNNSDQQNRMINIFDNFLRNIDNINFNENLNENISLNNFNTFNNFNNFNTFNNFNNFNTFNNFNNFNFNNLDPINTDFLQDDVKIILTEEEFNNIESITFKKNNEIENKSENDDKNDYENNDEIIKNIIDGIIENVIDNNTVKKSCYRIIYTECLVCTEYFEENNILKKLKCNHIFHIDCIKPWLCEESNKCPICRIDIAEGIYK